MKVDMQMLCAFSVVLYMQMSILNKCLHEVLREYETKFGCMNSLVVSCQLGKFSIFSPPLMVWEVVIRLFSLRFLKEFLSFCG